MVDSIRLDEWLKELTEYKHQSADGFTSAEMAKTSGKSLAWTRTMMRKAFDEGRITMVGTRESTRIDGKPCWVPVYQIVKKKAK